MRGRDGGIDGETQRGEDEGVFGLRFIPARSPAERRACFVGLRHGTSRTSSEVAVCCELVGGVMVEWWKGEEGGGAGPKACGHEGEGRLSSI